MNPFMKSTWSYVTFLPARSMPATMPLHLFDVLGGDIALEQPGGSLHEEVEILAGLELLRVGQRSQKLVDLSSCQIAPLKSPLKRRALGVQEDPAVLVIPIRFRQPGLLLVAGGNRARFGTTGSSPSKQAGHSTSESFDPSKSPTLQPGVTL